MSIIEDRLALLESLELKSSSHRSWDEGACVMEAVSFIAGEPWSDHPQCASEVIGSFMRTWNDDLDDEGRQKLKPYIVKLVGSKASLDIEAKRAWLCVDWYIHHHTPAWLELAGMNEVAAKVRALPSLLDDAALTAATPLLEEANSQASAAWSAARSAAWSAARSAAWSAAARSAAWSAARSAAWSAAESAAIEVLQPVVPGLQESAFDLLDRMLALTDAA